MCFSACVIRCVGHKDYGLTSDSSSNLLIHNQQGKVTTHTRISQTQVHKEDKQRLLCSFWEINLDE